VAKWRAFRPGKRDASGPVPCRQTALQLSVVHILDDPGTRFRKKQQREASQHDDDNRGAETRPINLLLLA